MADPLNPRYDEPWDYSNLSHASQFLGSSEAPEIQQRHDSHSPWFEPQHDNHIEYMAGTTADYPPSGRFNLPEYPIDNLPSTHFTLVEYAERDFKPPFAHPQTALPTCDVWQLSHEHPMGTGTSPEISANHIRTDRYSSHETPLNRSSPSFRVPSQQPERSSYSDLPLCSDSWNLPNQFIESVYQQSLEQTWMDATSISCSLEEEVLSFTRSVGPPSPFPEQIPVQVRPARNSLPSRKLSIPLSEGILPLKLASPLIQDEYSRTQQKRPTTETAAPFEECVHMFETTPGAMKKVKRRRKLEPSSHESFKVTRKIGACLECRFRKRPCNPGTPCSYCIKVFGSPGVAKLTCYRESPFVGFGVTDYFVLSSRTRIIDFNIKSSGLDKMRQQDHIIIDGKSGPPKCHLPESIPICIELLESLSLEDQAEVWRTKKMIPSSNNPNSTPTSVVFIPDDDEALGQKLESWAVRYASKFSRFYWKNYPTAYAYNVGMSYVEKKLPEHELVSLLLKGVAISYVLRAGVKCEASEFNTVQARIDTVLYRRLQATESQLFASLQKIVWVSAGRLKREQLYPVAYVLWQTMRSTCLRASHLDNLVNRSKGSKSQTYKRNAAKLVHCFNLLLSTHTALFRSNSPIIMDFMDPANQDLLGGHEDLIIEAMKLREIILDFKKHSLSRLFKSSNWYKDDMYMRFRKVLNGRGLVEK